MIGASLLFTSNLATHTWKYCGTRFQFVDGTLQNTMPSIECFEKLRFFFIDDVLYMIRVLFDFWESIALVMNQTAGMINKLTIMLTTYQRSTIIHRNICKYMDSISRALCYIALPQCTCCVLHSDYSVTLLWCCCKWNLFELEMQSVMQIVYKYGLLMRGMVGNYCSRGEIQPWPSRPRLNFTEGSIIFPPFLE